MNSALSMQNSVNSVLPQDNSLNAWATHFNGGFTQQDQARLQAAQVDNERAYSEDQINSARKWEEYMQGSQVQRTMRDIEAAGLNPWLAIQGGVNSGSYHSVESGNSAGSSNRNANNSNVYSNSAMAVRIVGAIMDIVRDSWPSLKNVASAAASAK